MTERKKGFGYLALFLAYSAGSCVGKDSLRGRLMIESIRDANYYGQHALIIERKNGAKDMYLNQNDGTYKDSKISRNDIENFISQNDWRIPATQPTTQKAEKENE